MIIKKPYAFLIKNFRIIHLILCVLLTYIFIKTLKIFYFFNGYASNGFYSYYENLASNFINFYMFIVVIIVLVSVSFVYMLLNWKDKARKFYIFLGIYYVIIFVSFIVLFLTLNSIISNPLDVRSVRIIRDLIMLITFPQVIFIVFSLIRGLGFDIKKFEFNKDVEELEIVDADSEEIEVIIGKNSYKILRNIRKILREIKYFALENKFTFTIISIVVVLIISLTIVLNKEVYNKVYNEGSSFSSNGLKISIVESYQTNTDYSGNIINKDKYYVILKVKVINNSSEDFSINTDYYRLLAGNKTFYPLYGKNNYFIDLGQTYNREKFSSNKEKEVLMVYELNNNDIKSSYVLKVFEKISVLKGEINPTNKEIQINPKLFKTNKDIFKYNIKQPITFEKTSLLDTLFRVDSYSIGEKFQEEYKYCTSSKCYNGKNIITPVTENNVEKVLLKLNTYYELDQNVIMKKSINNSLNFVNNFGYIEYTINGKLKETKAKIVEGKNENIIYIESPKEITTASNISLVIVIRNYIYEIRLK